MGQADGGAALYTQVGSLSGGGNGRAFTFLLIPAGGCCA